MIEVTDMIEIKNLTKHYKNFTLDDVSMEIPSGRITGFIGANGAGKSTTFKAILGLIKTDGGEILINGKNIKDFSEKDKAQIGCVMTDPSESMKVLFEHLYKNGHRNIVYLHGERGKFITEARISALEKAAADPACSGVTLRLFPSRYYSIEGGYDSMKKLLAATPSDRPTAVIASDDYSAIGVMEAIRDEGLSVPNDISVVGFDGIEITQRSSLKLTTIRQDTKAIGEEAAKNLLAQISGEGNVPKTIKIPPQLILGESCKDLNQ